MRLPFLLPLSLLALTVPAAPALAVDAHEPNNRFDTGTTITTTAPLQGEGAGPADEDWFKVIARRSGTLTIALQAGSECAGSLQASLKEGYSAFGGDSGTVAAGQSLTLTTEATSGQSYHLSLWSDCETLSYTVTAGPAALIGTPNDSVNRPGRPTRRLALGLYNCLTQSQGVTGVDLDGIFPRFRFRPGGRYVDETIRTRPIGARYTYRAGRLTMFTARGRLLYTFRSFRDARGHYLVQQRPANPLICRR